MVSLSTTFLVGPLLIRTGASASITTTSTTTPIWISLTTTRIICTQTPATIIGAQLILTRLMPIPQDYISIKKDVITTHWYARVRLPLGGDSLTVQIGVYNVVVPIMITLSVKYTLGKVYLFPPQGLSLKKMSALPVSFTTSVSASHVSQAPINPPARTSAPPARRVQFPVQAHLDAPPAQLEHMT